MAASEQSLYHKLRKFTNETDFREEFEAWISFLTETPPSSATANVAGGVSPKPNSSQLKALCVQSIWLPVFYGCVAVSLPQFSIDPSFAFTLNSKFSLKQRKLLGACSSIVAESPLCSANLVKTVKEPKQDILVLIGLLESKSETAAQEREKAVARLVVGASTVPASRTERMRLSILRHFGEKGLQQLGMVCGVAAFHDAINELLCIDISPETERFALDVFAGTGWNVGAYRTCAAIVEKRKQSEVGQTGSRTQLKSLEEIAAIKEIELKRGSRQGSRHGSTTNASNVGKSIELTQGMLKSRSGGNVRSVEILAAQNEKMKSKSGNNLLSTDKMVEEPVSSQDEAIAAIQLLMNRPGSSIVRKSFTNPINQDVSSPVTSTSSNTDQVFSHTSTVKSISSFRDSAGGTDSVRPMVRVSIKRTSGGAETIPRGSLKRQQGSQPGPLEVASVSPALPIPSPALPSPAPAVAIPNAACPSPPVIHKQVQRASIETPQQVASLTSPAQSQFKRGSSVSQSNQQRGSIASSKRLSILSNINNKVRASEVVQGSVSRMKHNTSRSRSLPTLLPGGLLPEKEAPPPSNFKRRISFFKHGVQSVRMTTNLYKGFPSTTKSLNSWISSKFKFMPRYIEKISSFEAKRSFCYTLNTLLFTSLDNNPTNEHPYLMKSSEKFLLGYIYFSCIPNNYLSCHFAKLAKDAKICAADLKIALWRAKSFNLENTELPNQDYEYLTQVVAAKFAVRSHEHYQISPKLYRASKKNPWAIMEVVGLLGVFSLMQRYSAVVDDLQGLEPEVKSIVHSDYGKDAGLIRPDYGVNVTENKESVVTNTKSSGGKLWGGNVSL
ncbi:hypothetical protein BDR26DRAFT_1004798 [Obelidium mucronatum]|nr:hypothetical protein BDR26DRAFT_1004798 [Obelidium mucronatum]